jgi:ribosomal protein S18 acetylase RimI-like enzyme
VDNVIANVRLATPADIPAMIPLINTAFAVETFRAGTRTDAERLRKMMARGEFLLGHRSGELVASVYLEMSGTEGYLGMLAVAPEHQNRRLGWLMVEEAEEHCRNHGCTRMRLTVLSLRLELLPFYSKLGYTQTGTEEFLPSRPLKAGVKCHCIAMAKAL